MADHPILFSGPMVRAILNGTKTQTRRIVKGFALDLLRPDGFTPDYVALPENFNSPYGYAGDRLWVREACRFEVGLDGLSPKAIGAAALDAGYKMPWAPTQFEADGERINWQIVGTPLNRGPRPSPGRYRHARFMPRWASRITLEITGVRVERLNDISGADAAAEGVSFGNVTDPETGEIDRDACEAFEQLWESINGSGSWDENPWVWVVQFKQIALRGPLT